ncbi:GNAT family N-acetyltransferase [Kribbella sp. NPDC055071]
MVEPGGVEISRVLPDDESACAEAVAVMTAAAKTDCPDLTPSTPRGYALMLRYGWDLHPPEAFVARDTDGTAVGLLHLHLPTYENTNQVWMDISTHPDHRGRGVSAAMVDFAEQTTRELGRNMLGLGVLDVPGMDAFARSRGFERKSADINRRQELEGLDYAIVQRLYDEAAAASTDYELLRLSGRLPDDLIGGMVKLTESINDAPTDDLDIEDDVYSPERLRAYEEAQLKREENLYRVIARHKTTGELAGHTIIAVEQERPRIGEQHDTAVDRAHRGHRLGALVKSDMLLWLREQEPALAQVDTWNAESNNHMIGINEQLNYRIVVRHLSYQKPL